jgi:hypothetical protein
MTKSKLGKLLAAVVVLATIGTITAHSITKADGNPTTPGLADDPVVTKSYVDQKVAELVKAELAKNTPGTGVGSGSVAALEVVKVPVGQTLIVAAGGELILRTGKAVAFSPDANGLSDMTDGKDIAPGKPVGNNHLILFPREGRGVKHDKTSKSELIVLVRGGYQVQ